MKDLSSLELIRLSIEIENQVTQKGDLIPRPGKNLTLFSISRYKGGNISYFHRDIPNSIRDQIAALGAENALNDYVTVQQILSQHIRCEETFPGVGYYFAKIPSPDSFPDVVWHQGCYVIKVEGESVSWAWTSDSSEVAVELAVETAPDHRQVGYACQVVSAWAYHNMRDGKVAFYSHKVDNLASEILATDLGVLPYARVTTYAVKAETRKRLIRFPIPDRNRSAANVQDPPGGGAH
jgi:hypothetical protein